KRNPQKTSLVFISIILLSFMLLLQQSCKKTDNAFNNPVHEIDFSKKFFETKEPPTEAIATIIEKLKKENERTGFVNKLPAHCGLPVWDKLLQNQAVNSNQATQAASSLIQVADAGGDTLIIIPLTENSKELSS